MKGLLAFSLILLALAAVAVFYVHKHPEVLEESVRPVWDTRSIVCTGSEAVAGGRLFYVRNATNADYVLAAGGTVLVTRQTEHGLIADNATLEATYFPAGETVGLVIHGTAASYVLFDLRGRKRISLK